MSPTKHAKRFEVLYTHGQCSCVILVVEVLCRRLAMGESKVLLLHVQKKTMDDSDLCHLGPNLTLQDLDIGCLLIIHRVLSL